ncbi:MAG: hypothetical protein JJ863_06985 [Deltaproteobacteria bacterium]|nr:hypothetical protein [Deltaproteobacteria bacterium]
MSASLLAEIRPAPQSEVEGWRARAEGILLARPDARRIGDDEIALDAGEGRNVVVRFGDLGLSFHGVVEDSAWYDEEHGTWEDDEGVNDPIDELVWSVGRAICVSLRWGLHTKRGVLPYLPTPCGGCEALVFDDQERCGQCGHPLRPDEFEEPETIPEEAAVEAHAERLVRRLIADGLLELASARSEPGVAQRMVGPLMNGWAAGEIAELLLELSPVSDLFCDDDDLAALIEATRQ